MSENTQEYGFTTWDEVELDQPQARPQRDPYMRLEEGSNLVRIITRPAQYVVHKWKPDGHSGFGRKVNCSKPKGSCPLCEKGDRPKRRWLAGVIDRQTQSTAILDMGPAIFKSVQEFSRDEDLGDPGRYDINIKVNRKGGATGYYTVIPKPPRPLSEEDLAKKEAFDLEELKRKVQPPTAETVLTRMQNIQNGTFGSNGQSNSNTAAPAAAPTGSDGNWDFPAANVDA